jgi:hypothetical protein
MICNSRSVKQTASGDMDDGPQYAATIRVGVQRTVLSRLRPLAGPLFSVRRRTASSSIAILAAMSSFQHGEPARVDPWRATHGHSQGFRRSSTCRSPWRSYQRAQPGQGSCVGGFGDGHVQRRRPIATNRSIACGVICATECRASSVRRVPLMAYLASSRRHSAAVRYQA